ncbi:MAG: class I SAM-dependent methyltransferase [Anaerolineales bacterium]|jgi:SAM-dependent methyltransferase
MEWHKRFVQQAAWTSEIRLYLFKRAGMLAARRVLEVGCGTGVILSGLATHAAIHGLDKDLARLTEACHHAPKANLACADALSLPYASGIFDITFCHFLLLWVGNPLQALCEMKRVTRPGGTILALAEPDYGARVDKPDELAVLGRWQTESLRRQGANPAIGIQLPDLFRQAGIRPIETGRLHTDGKHLPGPVDRELEWAVMEADLVGLAPVAEIQWLKRLDEAAWGRGERVLQVPTYWMLGSSV